ncbi:hypothetical protein IRJ41_002516 [Triplophysa rosa]|uniref:Uncharacterized protein n=1 Tax=Triplophysa rosa TaxID=992332 RepID=A0A9W7X106_TRIRA|nr:hypothetical protein IRJ41_002516 [Triplophysa rosa]
MPAALVMSDKLGTNGVLFRARRSSTSLSVCLLFPSSPPRETNKTGREKHKSDLCMLQASEDLPKLILEVENADRIPGLLLCGSAVASERGTGSNRENNGETSDDRTITAALNTLNILSMGTLKRSAF